MCVTVVLSRSPVIARYARRARARGERAPRGGGSGWLGMARDGCMALGTRVGLGWLGMVLLHRQARRLAVQARRLTRETEPSLHLPSLHPPNHKKSHGPITPPPSVEFRGLGEASQPRGRLSRLCRGAGFERILRTHPKAFCFLPSQQACHVWWLSREWMH